MTRIHNNLPFTVASTPMAGSFYITPSKRQKSPLKLLHNTANRLRHTAITPQFPMTAANTNILPRNLIQIASFNST